MCRADAIEVAAEDTLCGKGYELTLFVFTDIIVVAKVRIVFLVKKIISDLFCFAEKGSQGDGDDEVTQHRQPGHGGTAGYVDSQGGRDFLI